MAYGELSSGSGCGVSEQAEVLAFYEKKVQR